MSLKSKQLVKAAMLLRPQYKRYQRNLLPKTVENLVKITQAPKPLIYKLHSIPPQNINHQYFPHPDPLAPLETLPFHIQRTSTGNLPIYMQYNSNHKIKRTVIRKISGDIDKFCEQLQKVVSNYEIRKKVGYVEIPGVHKQSVFHWLYRLGF